MDKGLRVKGSGQENRNYSLAAGRLGFMCVGVLGVASLKVWVFRLQGFGGLGFQAFWFRI